MNDFEKEVAFIWILYSYSDTIEDDILGVIMGETVKV